MTKSHSSGQKAAPSAVESASPGSEKQRRSLRVQQLSQFALDESLRKRVSSSSRKRTQTLNVGGGIDRSSSKSIRFESTKTADATKVRTAGSKSSTNRTTFSELDDPLQPNSSCALNSSIATEEDAGDPPASGSSNSHAYRRLEASFFHCDALELAPMLLGKLLRRDEVILQITEVEAYRPNDTACHARVGKTARTQPLFGPAGHAYVYLCYGMHVMLNVVADRVDVGAAVLIRACSPVAGIKTIQTRRGQVTEKPVLLTGPGKVGQALGLTTEWTNHPLYSPGGLEILDAPKAEKVLVGPRVGIDYAEPRDVAALWRFALADTPWVSAPRSTLRPISDE
ncbi:DNA-3-methyladenine glycosylase [Marchantia polymorpha subsp. ruderalis]|uniref:DNA-3-methyladenine glycosylase II n=2 Tax=Marchantia polymorpha TaxID=3197 RepID=A0AAF6BYW4_MARPO|nr:hypothetical protein MARPO_0003s0280 [Marchantia polymorpha]BBN17198.1 hypothetical protein Mp_7g12720 [Marchantia polymorpha subsp. ruderalis]|eukprot:PTQ49433.1 hypothetical protein MARPO_0003s0280 [Marchantia polymorpha]